MVSTQGRNTWTIDDFVPYVEKLVIISEEQERITEPMSHGPASEREFPAPEFHILQSSVETRGIGRRRELVEAEQYSQQMMERGHGMYYTLATFSQYPSQMYQYPFEGHHTDTSTSEHSYGGVAETQPHFFMAHYASFTAARCPHCNTQRPICSTMECTRSNT